MAKTSCKVRFGKFRANKAGYASVMDSGSVQGILRGKAAAVRDAADSMISSDGYLFPGHEMKPIQGLLAQGYVVRTQTDHARYASAKRNTLLKALGAAK